MKQYSFLILIILLIVEIQVQTSCANIIPPGGGPKDSLPPVLLKSNPPDSSLHFNANKITLTFDEFVQLDNNIQSNLVVSPNPVQMPFVESKLQAVTVRLKDSLLPNTTYSINFGDNLKDVNEGNPYKNFTYVFSTGASIATGTLSGSVQLAQTGTTDSTLIVILHKDLNDSAIKKERPYYYAHLDSSGKFIFKFLADGKYAVYVLPNDYSKRYDDSTKLFAFSNEPVIIDSNSTPSVMLYVYNEFKPDKNPGTPAVNETSKSNKKTKADTTKSITFTTNLQRAQQDLLSNFIIQFDKPLANFDSSLISLTDTNFHSINNYHITADTSLSTFTLKYSWKEDQYFKLVIKKNAFADSAGITLAKPDTISFETAAASDYGSVRLRFGNLNFSKNPVLQFIQNNVIVDSAALTQSEFFRILFKPGDYDLRILYDDNKNTTWDAGNFEMKKQPEIVIRIPRRLTIKQNWDNEVNINL